MGDGHVVELYVRSLAAGDDQARLKEALSRLESLDEAERIDDYEVHVWGDGVCLDPAIRGTDTGEFICQRVASFREWASETGHELVGFADRTRHSAITGRVHEYIAVPAMAVCERRDGAIERVAPAVRDGSLTSVSDCFATIETADRLASDGLHGTSP